MSDVVLLYSPFVVEHARVSVFATVRSTTLLSITGDLSHLRAVRTTSANKFADDNNMYTFFMSAKSGDQVHTVSCWWTARGLLSIIVVHVTPSQDWTCCSRDGVRCKLCLTSPIAPQRTASLEQS